MSELEFPTLSWITVALGDLSEVKSGVGFPKKYQGQSSGDYPVYKVGDVSRAVTQNNGLLGAANHYVKTDEAEALKGAIFRAGSTLFAKIGEAVKLNRRAFVILPGLADNNVMAVVPVLSESDKYLHYLLRTVDLSDVSRSTTVPSVRKGDIEDLKIPFPPLAEQKVIADKLDTLLAQVENTKARLERIPQILKRFRQSVLAAAVSGRLTEDWRVGDVTTSNGHELHRQIKEAHAVEGGHARGNASKPTEEAHDLNSDDLPDTWDIAQMRDVCVPGRPITYGILKPGPELEDGVPYIRVADFPGNKLSMAKIKKTSVEIDHQFKRARLSEGDLLLSIRGSVGRLIKIPATLEGANITQDTARLSISPLVSPDFVYWILLADSTQRRMKNATRGVAVRGINIGDVRALQVPLPPLAEQTEIVRRVDQLVAHADRIEQQVNDALARVKNLTQSILAKAFRGELTEQWRKDNPQLISGDNSAEALLERIKSERAAQKPAGRQSKKKKSEMPAT